MTLQNRHGWRLRAAPGFLPLLEDHEQTTLATETFQRETQAKSGSQSLTLQHGKRGRPEAKTCERTPALTTSKRPVPPGVPAFQEDPEHEQGAQQLRPSALPRAAPPTLSAILSSQVVVPPRGGGIAAAVLGVVASCALSAGAARSPASTSRAPFLLALLRAAAAKAPPPPPPPSLPFLQ